jgi:hypothetical protein
VVGLLEETRQGGGEADKGKALTFANLLIVLEEEGDLFVKKSERRE